MLIYPNNPGMILGLGSALALKGNTDEAIELMERGLPLSINEKKKTKCNYNVLTQRKNDIIVNIRDVTYSFN